MKNLISKESGAMRWLLLFVLVLCLWCIKKTSPPPNYGDVQNGMLWVPDGDGGRWVLQKEDDEVPEDQWIDCFVVVSTPAYGPQMVAIVCFEGNIGAVISQKRLGERLIKGSAKGRKKR